MQQEVIYTKDIEVTPRKLLIDSPLNCQAALTFSKKEPAYKEKRSADTTFMPANRQPCR